MSHVATLDGMPDRDVEPPVRVRSRLLALAAACVLGGLALAAGLALHWAALEQRSVEQRALMAADATIHAADREVAAAVARLEALATSPALRVGDLKAFYDQLVATPMPDGTWLVLYDTERQLLNTRRQFGASPLPRIADFDAGSQAAARRIRETRRPAVSPVVWGVLAQMHLVAVTIPVVIDDVVGHLMSAVLSDRRLGAVLEEQPLPPGWRSLLLDRNGGTVAHARMAERPNGPGVPENWAGRLRGPVAQATFFGDRDGRPVLVAFARSPTADWTAVAEVP
jgi:two-component system NarL family sensor kinase